MIAMEEVKLVLQNAKISGDISKRRKFYAAEVGTDNMNLEKERLRCFFIYWFSRISFHCFCHKEICFEEKK